jgi:hypothetical protein
MPFVPITWRVVPALLADWARRNWLGILLSLVFLALLWRQL